MKIPQKIWILEKKKKIIRKKDSTSGLIIKIGILLSGYFTFSVLSLSVATCEGFTVIIKTALALASIPKFACFSEEQPPFDAIWKHSRIMILCFKFLYLFEKENYNNC